MKNINKFIVGVWVYVLALPSFSQDLNQTEPLTTGNMYSVECIAKTISEGNYKIVSFDSQKGFISVSRNGHEGIIDMTGKLIVPCDYYEITINDGYFVVWGGEKNEYNEISLDKQGVIDFNGKVIVKCIYDWADYNDGVGCASFDGKQFFFDKTGQKLSLPTTNLEGECFHEGLLRIRTEGTIEEQKYGFMDKTGKVVIPCIYTDANHFVEGGVASVSKNVNMRKKWGLIDTKGNIVAPFEYDNSINFDSYSSEYSSTSKNGKCIYINKKGREFPFSLLFSPNEDTSKLLVFCMNNKYGCIDRNGNIVVPCQYNRIMSFQEGAAVVEKVQPNGKTLKGFINDSGKLFVPCIHQELKGFHDGMAAVKKDGKFGFIDKTGKLVIPYLFEYIKDFSGGFAAIKKDGKLGYIDKTGKIVIPCEYDYADGFINGIAKVKKGNSFGVIDVGGNVVVPLIYDEISNFKYGIAYAEKDGVKGFIDTKGNNTFNLGKLTNESATSHVNSTVESANEKGISELDNNDTAATLPNVDQMIKDLNYAGELCEVARNTDNKTDKIENLKKAYEIYRNIESNPNTPNVFSDASFIKYGVEY